MKHIFTIHSHVTFLAALGTIKLENIKPKSVIILCNANYKPTLPEKLKVKLCYNTSESGLTLLEKLAVFLPFSYSIKTNQFIKDISNDENYIAYIDLMTSFNKFLVLNEKCQSFNIIEEGIVNYGKFIDFNLLTADLKKQDWVWFNRSHLKDLFKAMFRLYRGRSLKMQKLPIHPNIYSQFPNVNSYCFSELAFPQTSIENKRILNFKILSKNGLQSAYFPEHSWFWIGDVLCKQYGIEIDILKIAIEKILKKINPKKETRIIYLKFRGSEPENEKKITLHLLEKYGFKVEILSSSTILEIIFANGLNFHVCGIASSLLIYAFNAGHKTYSALPYIPDEYGISVYKSYPSIYKKVYANL